ncbi:hypothetical protein FA95DRAFT_1579903 [Auriscalpium vulgare]|uniref:Uncharacterized protein n=1 Tax=Auriscalpium vulgare TaxID=40419 RepID=A0ACB8S8R7_9AGAM|nr:hypothetical protein FA95DRAFT_1579903 [Auriscalpium vulgare]
MPVESSDYIVLVLAVASAYLLFLFARPLRVQTTLVPVDLGPGHPKSETKQDEKDENRHRKPGSPVTAWRSVSFDYPKITPLEKKLQDIQQRPYRPFKSGIYHITMGIRSMEWDEWIELDNQFAAFYRLRAQRIAQRGSRLVQVVPDRPGLVRGGAEAAKELVYELAEFLSRRFPTVFSVRRPPIAGRASGGVHESGWYGEGAIQDITILPLNVTYNLEEEDPMTLAALLVQDDLAIMIEGEDGQYYLQAGAILVPGSWRLEDKIGMPLDEIHFSGEVPFYAQKLQTSLNRFFRRLTTGTPVVRENWLIQTLDPKNLSRPGDIVENDDPEELAWNSTAYGSEDKFSHVPSSYALSLGSPLREPTPSTRPPVPKVTHQTLRLRTEHQTLRRLPKTGAIVFTIRTYMTSIEELGREPGIPARLAGAVRGVKGEVRKRKRQEAYEQVLLDYLDQCHQKQVDSGIQDP